MRVSQLMLLLALVWGTSVQPGHAQPDVPPCTNRAWRPAYKLKDHAIFFAGGFYYLAANMIDPPLRWENQFAYARSADLCTWEDLGTVLAERTPGAWDDMGVWAPFVYEEDGTFYLFYTGVTVHFTQSIMLATSTNPADPQAWQPQGMVFQPNHPGMIWPGRGSWSDARDPTVLKHKDRYYLYYTGNDHAGGIIGVATAQQLTGPWVDQGALVTVPGAMLESATVVRYGESFYMVYNRTGPGPAGPELRAGPSPIGPWQAPQPLAPGWAHELWTTTNGVWMTSFLTDYSVSISPIHWNDAWSSTRLVIGERIWRTWLPLVQRA